MARLPEDALCQVLPYVPLMDSVVFSAVCSLWRSAVRSSLHLLDFYDAPVLVSGDTHHLRLFLEMAPSIKEVRFTYQTPSTLLPALHVMGRLKLRLQLLDFHRCTDVSEDVLHCIAHHFPTLTALALPSTMTATAEHVAHTLQHLPCLVNLRSPHLPPIPTLAFQTLTLDTVDDAGIERCTAGMPHLTALSIATSPHLTSSGLQAIAQACRQLQCLELHESNLDSRTLARFAVHCPQLTSLTLGKCPALNDPSLRATLPPSYPVSQHSRLMAELGESRRSDHHHHSWIPIDQIICNSWQLQQLTLWKVHVSDEGVQAVLRCCPCLHTVVLREVPTITDAALAGLAMHCPRLRGLGLRGSLELTDAAALEAAACTGLQSIDLSSLPLFSSVGFRTLVDSCHDLRTVLCSLHIAYTLRLPQEVLSDTLVAELWNSAPRLQYFRTSQQPLSASAFLTAGIALRGLWLSDCPSIDDEALQVIVQRCSALRQLVLRATPRRGLSISSMGLASVGELLTLEELDITYSPRLWSGLCAVVQRCRALRRVNLGPHFLETEKAHLLMDQNPFVAIRAMSREWCRAL